ncbi:MAG: DUF296 domain-containing protein [Deltaproteobacteria bacterium]|nr:DUF296 domain-containing protein [Deltaproteobacteria bacterium]RLB90909.1 MAG: DNA-binding protein [Deltaproteobacteria bacterium]RLB96535.1 MAG: DNA-binding protein [Deltaproteobacteria bacterium]RLC12655.1 MAG: DNA-binding protein [Deltaproteobacteria bacterium]
MEKTAYASVSEFKPGRFLLGKLPQNEDLIVSILGICAANSVQTAVFSVIGSVTSATLGSYDQYQHVYVTFKKSEPLEIIHCTGNVSLKEGNPHVHAHGVFADMNGQTVAGHVFSKTLIYAGEIFIQELLGKPLSRKYDERTGLFLWNMPGP